MTILLQLLKLVFPLLKEYGLSSLRMKRGGKNIVFVATAATIFILTMFIGYLNEQATNNLRLHEPLSRQYQSLERNNIRLSEQLEASRQSQYSCDSMLQEYRQSTGQVKTSNSTYDPEKKIMVSSDQSK